MSEVIDNEVYYTAKEITELCSVTPSAFNNAVYRHSLARIMHNKHWHYPQSSLDAYRRICAKQTTPLQSQSTSTELPPAALQSLDPLEEPEIIADAPPVYFESFVNEAQPATTEISPEIAMLSLVLSQLRRKVAAEQRESQAVNDWPGSLFAYAPVISVGVAGSGRLRISRSSAKLLL